MDPSRLINQSVWSIKSSNFYVVKNHNYSNNNNNTNTNNTNTKRGEINKSKHMDTAKFELFSLSY